MVMVRVMVTVKVMVRVMVRDRVRVRVMVMVRARIRVTVRVKVMVMVRVMVTVRKIKFIKGKTYETKIIRNVLSGSRNHNSLLWSFNLKTKNNYRIY